jgi:hypothetical protein
MEITANKTKPLSTEQALLKLKAFIEREKSRSEEFEEALTGESVELNSRRIEDDVVHRLNLLAQSMESILPVSQQVIVIEDHE